MGTLLTFIAGAAGGIVLGIMCFAVIIAAVTVSREGPGTGFIVLLVSPFYLLLHIVAVCNTLIPAGVITGIAAGLAMAFLRRPRDLLLTSLRGIITGGFSGARFTDIFLEGRASQTDIVVGTTAGGLCLSLSGPALLLLLRRRCAKRTSNIYNS